MRSNRLTIQLAALFAIVFIGLPCALAGDTPVGGVPVRMTVTLRLLGDNKRMPDVKREDVIVKQDKERLQVTGWTPAQGDRVGLDFFVLIDDSSESSLGSQLDDLRSFINNLPKNSAVGVGYMRNGTVQMVQNFTSDRAQAAKALRIPMASNAAFGSPYLSVVDLMKRWPAGPNRREILMVTDGIDRARSGPRSPNAFNSDVDSASTVAQRTGTIIHTIFARGIGRLGSNYWEITNGQNGIARLSDDSGGESYYLGTQGAVSFKPYLDDIQKDLANQYLLEFNAVPGKKAGLQDINLSTEVAGVELESANSVWVAPK